MFTAACEQLRSCIHTQCSFQIMPLRNWWIYYMAHKKCVTWALQAQSLLEIDLRISGLLHWKSNSIYKLDITWSVIYWKVTLNFTVKGAFIDPRFLQEITPVLLSKGPVLPPPLAILWNEHCIYLSEIIVTI
jgi:hypothetical protein